MSPTKLFIIAVLLMALLGAATLPLILAFRMQKERVEAKVMAAAD